MKQAGRIFRQALLLTTVTLLMRTAGVSFSVYISNKVGAEAMGLYSLLSGVYSFALTLATSGIFLGTTRMVSEAIGENKSGQVKAVMVRCIAYAAGFGVLAAVLLYSFSDLIGSVWLSDVRTVSSLRLLAFTLPLISLSTAFSGYFTAVRRVYKSAAAQVLEDAVRIGATCYLLVSLSSGGIEAACIALVLGGVISDVSVFVINLLLYLIDRRKKIPADRQVPGRSIAKKLLGITLPVAFSAYIRSGLITLEHILIPPGLTKYGASRADALATYGTIHSMVMPVVLFPSAIISSFSGLLVPEMSEARVKGEHRHERYIIGRVFTFAMLFSIGTAGILACFSHELGEYLYPGTDAARYIRILAPLVPIMYIDTAVDALLKGMGEQVYSMNINIADALISVALVWFLLPRYGIDGYIITIFVTESFNTAFSLARLMKISGFLPSFTKNLLRPALCVLGAASIAKMTFTRLPVCPGGVIRLVIHLAVTVILYGVLLLITRTVSREEVAWVRSILKPEQKKTIAKDRPEAQIT